MNPRRLYLAACWFSLVILTEATAQEYVFTDAGITCTFPGATRYTLRILDRQGLSPETKGDIIDGSLQLDLPREGIYIVTPNTGKEQRFLAMDPPAPLDKAALRRALPRNADLLLKGEPFRLLSMGDSVTATGDYETMLKMMLERATGNHRLEVIDRSYPGRSVDASIRNFEADAVETKPHAAMIMYGLNDQGAGCSLKGYIEQFEWLVTRLREDCNADPLILLPTPDISRDKDATVYTPYVIRTVGYATWLRAQIQAPVVDTFQAIWGNGGDSLEASATSLEPLFPVHYSKQFTTMRENNVRGDGIHPNALGHLAIAKAVYATLIGQASPPTTFQTTASWGDCLQADIKTDKQLEIYPVPHETIEVARTNDGYHVTWPHIKDGHGLLTYPANLYLYDIAPTLILIDYSGAGSQVYGVRPQFEEPYSVSRYRASVPPMPANAGESVTDPTAISVGGMVMPQPYPTPNALVSRKPFVEKSPSGKNWAAAEIAWVRYGAAKAGEATVDGDLAEWTGHHWFPVGEQVQARWSRGHADHRTSVDECYTQWSLKAGENGLYLAARIRGQVESDSITVFFDPRAPELLGTPGPYYWLSIGHGKNGKLQLRPGETSDRKQPELAGVWQATDSGAALEIFVPYSLMKIDAWPASGDLGLSIDWRHKSPNPEAPDTHLQWSEDGHPWNPRWYGVVRLTDDIDSLPYMFRIK